MKKWFFVIISFIIFFSIFVTLIFEFVFRFLTADFVIGLMDRLGFLGVHASLETLVAILVIISLLVSFVFSRLVFMKINKVR